MIIRDILKNTVPVLTLLLFCACGHNSAPDVSGIKVNIKVARFDRFMFEKTDTNAIVQGVANLRSAFPYFTDDFLTYVLGLPQVKNRKDSSAMITYSELRRFIRISRPLYDSLSGKFEETAWLDEELTDAFKYVKYHFPAYQVPAIVAYIGPLNAPGIAITNQALAIGLQLYAGKNFSYYSSVEGLEMFPIYISRTFEPQYISSNAMKAVAEDLFPDQSAGKPLIDQMIEKGKQWWLVNKFLPNAPDSVKTGFRTDQLSWCSKNEGFIWNYFLQNNNLYTTEPSLIKDYIGESPSTPGMPPESPGNIGQWIGWRIVEKYQEKNPGLSPDVIMKTEPRTIFFGSKYKPRI
ncbi:MAG: hypothetical protein WKF89_13450 [Chitinophagaceae bacterium]